MPGGLRGLQNRCRPCWCRARWVRFLPSPQFHFITVQPPRAPPGADRPSARRLERPVHRAPPRSSRQGRRSTGASPGTQGVSASHPNSPPEAQAPPRLCLPGAGKLPAWSPTKAPRPPPSRAPSPSTYRSRADGSRASESPLPAELLRLAPLWRPAAEFSIIGSGWRHRRMVHIDRSEQPRKRALLARRTPRMNSPAGPTRIWRYSGRPGQPLRSASP